MSMKGKADPGTVKYKKEMAALRKETQAKLFGYADDLIAEHEAFYDENITPLLDSLYEQVDYAQDNFDELRQTALEFMNDREETYQTQGKEGLDFFMARALGKDTSAWFDEEAYAAAEGRRAIGDITNQQQVAQQIAQRQMSARGINANSGVAMAGLQVGNMNAALAKAGAMEQARRAALQEGAARAQAAGTMGAQMQTWAAPYMQAAGQMTDMGVNLQNSKLAATGLALEARTGGIRSAAGIISPMNSAAMSGEGKAVSDIAQQKAQDAAGWGSLIGKVAGIGLSFIPGGQAAGAALIKSS